MDKFTVFVFSLSVLFFLVGPKLWSWIWPKNNIELLNDAIARCRRQGLKFSRKKFDEITEQTFDEVVDAEKTMLDNVDQLDMSFSNSVVMAETLEEAAARQEREQQMFGDGVPRSVPGKGD